MARLLVYGEADRSELRQLVYRFEDELLGGVLTASTSAACLNSRSVWMCR